MPAIVEVHQQVARLLQHPSRVRAARAGEVFDPTAADREEDKHVQAAKPDGVDGQEVASDDRITLLAQEAAPGQPVALRRGRDAGVGEHAAHQRRGNVDAELAELADDPGVPPARVLARQPHDQLPYLQRDRRPARPAVRIRPAASDQAPVPAQQRLWPNREPAPGAARRDPAERRQHEPVSRLESRPSDLPAQDRQLVPEHEDLELLRSISTGEQHQQRQ